MADEKQGKDARKLRFFRPEDSANIYSNSVRISTTPWDFRFLFGEIGDPLVDGELPVSESIRVTMSPSHAKAFLDVLRKRVEKFENTYGEIRTPDRRELGEDDNKDQPQTSG